MFKFVAVAVAALFAANLALAQEASCESKAVGKNGKALAGAAKNAFMKKCEADAKTATCAAKALSKDGKPLHGAAKNAFVKKCNAGT